VLRELWEAMGVLCTDEVVCCVVFYAHSIFYTIFSPFMSFFLSCTSVPAVYWDLFPTSNPL
jgi:hypothetical protein